MLKPLLLIPLLLTTLGATAATSYREICADLGRTELKCADCTTPFKISMDTRYHIAKHFEESAKAKQILNKKSATQPANKNTLFTADINSESVIASLNQSKWGKPHIEEMKDASGMVTGEVARYKTKITTHAIDGKQTSEEVFVVVCHRGNCKSDNRPAQPGDVLSIYPDKFNRGE